jgi:quercetin dioxygenase-like cupin family protein
MTDRDHSPVDELFGELEAGDAPDARNALALWAAERLRTEAPSPALRQRLLGTIEGPDRFLPFVSTICRIFDLTAGEALRDLLARIDEASGWLYHGQARYFHFTPGPALAGLEAGVVRMARGVVFPRHLHRRGEITLVLEGIMQDRGRSYGPGAVIESGAGTSHDYSAGGTGRDLVLLSRHGGIEFLPES